MSSSNRATPRFARFGIVDDAGDPVGLERGILVLSPHFDDAVFSLGAVIRRASRAGVRVTVLTVLGNDPDSERPASEWDRRSGFTTEGAAAQARKVEDRRACALLGAQQADHRFRDAQYGRDVEDDEVWAPIESACAGVDLCLVPGFPLSHSDHAWLAGLVVGRGLPGTRIGLYLEQPYAASAKNPRRWVRRPGLARALEEHLPRTPRWTAVPAAARERIAKVRACYAYRSQLPLLPGRSLLPWRIAMHETVTGGESIAVIK